MEGTRMRCAIASISIMVLSRILLAEDRAHLGFSFPTGNQPARWDGSYLGQGYSIIAPAGGTRLRIATGPGHPEETATYITPGMTRGSGAIPDWHNSGGNASRNGQSSQIGPAAPTILWSGGRFSNVGWLPIIEGNRLFTVRLTSFPGCGAGAGPVVASDLETGAELWVTDLPCVGGGDWFPWVGGVKNGRVFASRAGSDGTPFGKLYALDAVTGSILWQSIEDVDAGAYDGIVFAPNGDPIVGGFQDLWRINALNGATVWNSSRVCSVSGSCGPAVFGSAAYVADAAPGFNHVIKRYDLATGAFMYQSSLMPGFTIQQSPMVGPDGTIYLARTQNNPAVDFFYSLHDSGIAISINWSVAAGWATTAEFAVGPDGSIYMLAPGNEIHRLDAMTGATLDASAPIPAQFPGPRMVVDPQGKLFVGQRGNGDGRLYSFDADLTARWDIPVGNINIGGPSMGQDGTLIVCNSGTDVRAFRTTCTCQLYGDIAPTGGDCNVDVGDVLAVLDGFAGIVPWDALADISPCGGDGNVDVGDVLAVLDSFAAAYACPHPCPP